MASLRDLDSKPITSKVVCYSIINAVGAIYIPKKITTLTLNMEVLTVEGTGLTKAKIADVVNGYTGIEKHVQWVLVYFDSTDYRIHISDFLSEIERLKSE